MSKIIEDTMPKAADVLKECMGLTNELCKVAEALAPYSSVEPGKFATLPAYLAWSVNELKQAAITGFSVNYPNLSEMFANCQNSDEGMRRMHDGIYKVGQIAAELSAHKYLIKFDEQRAALAEQTKQAIGDMCIFLITQYQLYSGEEDGILLSVHSYCERNGITSSVLYGGLLLKLEWVGVEPYGYESISEYRQDLIDIDPVFVAECEECAFPLTKQLSQDIISGKVSISEARGLLTTFLQQTDETTVEGMTPASMIKQMHLD